MPSILRSGETLSARMRIGIAANEIRETHSLLDRVVATWGGKAESPVRNGFRGSEGECSGWGTRRDSDTSSPYSTANSDSVRTPNLRVTASSAGSFQRRRVSMSVGSLADVPEAAVW